MGVVIVTDSGVDYTAAEARAANIEVVPVWMLYGTQRLRDGVDLSFDEFYRRLTTADEIPTTEPADVVDYERIFQKIVDGGNDVVCITLSSQISKSFENAQTAAKAFGARVQVIDSHGAAGGIRLICDYANELARAGTSAIEIAQMATPKALHLQAYFAVADVKHLGKSGRLPKALVALGSMLNVSLIFKMNETGAIGPAGQSRSFDKTLELMVDALIRSIKDDPTARVAISHVRAAETAASLAAMVEAKLGYPPRALSVHECTPTIATHQGAGAVGVFAISPP